MLKKELKNKIQNSSIENKKSMLEFLNYLNEDQLKVLASEIEQNPKLLQFISSNIDKKIKAINNMNMGTILWDAILDEEENFLENY